MAAIKQVALLNTELTIDERNLLSVGYKHVISGSWSHDHFFPFAIGFSPAAPLRNAWRVISSIEEKGDDVQAQAQFLREYRGKIEGELKAICHELIALVDSHLLPNAVAADTRIFYYKMKGDYFRYLAEFLSGEEHKVRAKSFVFHSINILLLPQTATDGALQAYQGAMDIATADLPPSHPIRLGLALNFSVFYYEILTQPEKACALAKQVWGVI